MSAASASGRSRHPRLAAFAVGFALVVAVTTLALVVVFFLGLPYDGKCPEGSFPATNPAVGGDCFTEGDGLPDGFTADPGGNTGVERR
ncbi:hypothetical protein BH24ACT11_BH24ACT11_11740 [soil metagenome]